MLGHVDHGKTSLLDAIRKTNVADREAGGITQSIGASVVTTSTGTITFIDTPGHAAFSKMRSRGANVSDIAILVVAASEGPMPQTKEALAFIREAGIPLVVALTKVDLPNANTEKVKAALEAEGILFEGRGGDTPSVEVSAREGKGIPELLEVIQLLSDVNDVTADPDGPLTAVTIETNRDKAGARASVIVRNGTLKVGDDVSSEGMKARVRGLFSADGKSVREAKPSEPVVLLGFAETPPVGSVVTRSSETAEVKKVVTRLAPQNGPKKASNEEKIKIIVKAASAGSLEALLALIPSEFEVLASGLGDVSDSDIFFAKAASANIFTFESKAPGATRKLAENEGIVIESFTIIYELLKRLDDILLGGQIMLMGEADILEVFPFSGKRVAGSKVRHGKIAKKDKLLLMRGPDEVGQVRVHSIRKGRDEVNEVGQGEECGILFEPQLAFQVGDVLLSVK